ncbi:MAG: ABC transporter permease subunit [Myxococcales bacterium]|jgi:ABC-2 type transport system permease protein|nr:ABC transporter permease subunit [Myxococcales bacterium]
MSQSKKKGHDEDLEDEKDESEEEESEEEESDDDESKGDDDDGDDDGDDDDGEEEAKAKSKPEPEDPALTGAREKTRNHLRLPRGPAATYAMNVWTITKRELASYFNSPIAYIVISLTLVAFGLVCFFYLDFFQVNRASYSQFLGIPDGAPITVPPILCVITAPLFTMRSLSEEKRMGTLELLITLPVRDSEVILGKFLASMTMLLIIIGLLLAYPLVMFGWPWHLGPFDWGPFWAAMLGLVLLSMASVAIGMMFSSLTENQIVSLFLSVALLAGVFLIGRLVRFLPGWPGDLIAFFSFESRFEPFSRGVIDTRAVVYFVSIAVLALLVSFRSLESRKWR